MGWEQSLGNPSWKWVSLAKFLLFQELGSQGSPGDPSWKRNPLGEPLRSRHSQRSGIPGIPAGRKHMRQSTTEHTRQTFLRLQERQVQSKRKKGGPNYERPLTQEELLEEAKITEEINLRSLENYERLEADKKKQVQKKRKIVGPVIRYWSLTMPLLPEPGRDDPVDVEGLDPDSHSSSSSSSPLPAGKCSRTFISFSDDATFERCFPKSKAPRLPVRELCPVTHKPALYRDPITDIPYSNARAFRIIREAYRKYITAHGLPSAAAMAGGGDGPAAARPGRQKIVIKQSVPSA
uniref:Vacuolar protein sorting-associated protein 72 homolog n=1 Tax=Cyanistes caeruleus TaxID=156563 RepID=A0A8C0V835_CYACU